MTRACSGCGLHSCEGECYLASPSDFDGDPEFDEWLAKVEAEEAERIEQGNEVIRENNVRWMVKRRAA